MKKRFSSWDDFKTDIDSLEDGVLYDYEWIKGVQDIMKQNNTNEVLDLMDILPWRDEIRRHSADANASSKDISVKFSLEKKKTDQSMESYKWIIPIGNPRSIISQLQTLKNSMNSENSLNSTDLLQLKSDLLVYFCNRYIEKITILQEQPELLELFWKDCYFEEEQQDSVISKDLEAVISAFSSFSLRLLSFASTAGGDFFSTMYNELCNVLCNIPPKSLSNQPNIIHQTYAQIQDFLSSLSTNPSYFSSAMSNQIQITLALGTTESLFSIIRHILFSPPSTVFDLTTTVNYMNLLLQDVPPQHFFYCNGSNSHYQLCTDQCVDAFVYEEIPSARLHLICAMNDRSFFVGEDNHVYYSGCFFGDSPSNGVLMATGQEYPTQIRRFGNSANSSTVFLMMEDNTVFTFGDNSHYGMGCDLETKEFSTPTCLALPNQCVPIDVVGGVSHYLLVDSLGYVFAWGNNNENQCGFDPEKYSVIQKPSIINQLQNIRNVAAGERHSLFVDAEGKLFGCGSNHYGQLGLPTIEGYTDITLISLPFRVVKAVAGYTHSLLLGDDGCIYFSGSLMNTINMPTFTCVMDASRGPVRDIYSAGHCCAVWYANNTIWVWGDNSSKLFGSSLNTFIETPVQLPLYTKTVYSFNMSPTHLIVCLEEPSRTDLSIPISAEEKELLYEQWNPNNLIQYHMNSVSHIAPMDATSLLISYLAKSQDYYFTEQYNYAEFGTPAQLDHCFSPHVSDKSLGDCIEVIAYLHECYTQLYQKEEEIYKSNLSATSVPRTNLSFTEEISSTMSNTPKDLVTSANEMDGSLNASSEPPRIRLLQPSNERVIEESPQQAEFADFKLDNLDFSEMLNMNNTTSILDTIDTSQTISRSFTINKDFENKQVCYLLYQTIHLFRSQLVYLMSSRSSGFELLFDNKLESYFSTLLSVLMIDSNSNEMRLVKKDIVETMSLMCVFCKHAVDVKTILNIFFEHYAKAKKDPRLDHYSIFDGILGFFNKMQSYNVWDLLIRGPDMLTNIRCVVDTLSFAFTKLQDEFGGYTKRLSAEKYVMDLSNFTAGIVHILRVLYVLHNRSYNALYTGATKNLSEISTIMDILLDFCSHLFSFSTSVLERCVETITWENCISHEVGQLLSSSPVYKGIQYSIFILYSLVTRSRIMSEDMAYNNINLEKRHQSDLDHIRGLLRPLATMVVTMDRCIQYIEGHQNQAYVEYKEWMLDCSSLFTSFSSIVTSILIKQKPIEVDNSETNEENAMWLNSPLLSQGLCSDSQDPIRKKCLSLLRGELPEWYDAICKSKKLNKIQQRFLNADPNVADILRYITASYIWLSPSCYYSLYQGETVSPAITSAYTLASQILQHVNQLHQKSNKEYYELNTHFMNQSSFLLNVQPLWNMDLISDYPRAMADAYQYLKNEKVIEEEDEEEDIDKESDVNSAILTIAKKFVMGQADVSCLYTSIHARTYVAENRAVSFEYFSSLLLKVNNPRIRNDLMESIAKILEYRDEADNVRKTHFMFDLEGSSPVYIKRVSNAFASIIESNMKKIEHQGITTSDKTTILYSIAIPYSPNDAPLLQQSNVLLPLSRLWSFKNEFVRSKYLFRPSQLSTPTIFYTGNEYTDEKSTMTSAGRWKSVEMQDGVVEVALSASYMYALTQGGQVLQYARDGSATTLNMGSVPISSVVASPTGDHALFLSPNGNVLSTGANKHFQCGRSDFNNGMCNDVQAVLGSSSSMFIKAVACGKNHSIFLSNSNHVLGCGLNEYHQLGLTEPVIQATREIKVLKQHKIKYIACGDDFSLFATDTRLFVVGKNDCGQLGFDPAVKNVVTEVTEVQLPETIKTERIKNIYAGSRHVGILTHANRAFLMGNNNHGQLGNGTCVSSHQLLELSNMKVKDLKLGGDSTMLVSENVLYCMGDNSSNQFGLLTSVSCQYPQPTMDLTQFSLSSISIGMSTSVVVIKPDSFVQPPKPFTEKSLKVSYASWLLANLLFMSSCQDQLELSVFARECLHMFLRELSQISTWVGKRFIWNEWDEYSPRSLREGSVGMIKHLLATLENENYSTEPTPFTYMNQLLSTLVVSTRKSDGLAKALAEEASLSVLLPLFVQILSLHEKMSISTSCQYLYLDNQPYITPLLLCFQYLSSLLIMILPHALPSTVNQVIQNTVAPEILAEMTQGVPRKSDNALFILILLRTMGRTVNIPYGPIQITIPSPYYCRLFATKCVELIWSILPTKEWSYVINKCVTICCGLCISFESIVSRLTQQPIDFSAFSEFYLVAGCIAFYAGFPSVPCIDSQIAVTIGTLRQDGHVLMFRDRCRKFNWEGACVIKLSGSKELAWVSDTRELTLVTNRIPIDSYSLLSRVFDNYEHILKSRSNNRHVRSSYILGQIQQAVMYSIMKLLQFPQAAPHISLSTIRSVVNFLRIPIPVQYANASIDALKERQELIEGYWKLQVWDSIQSSLVTTTTIDYNINSWPPAIPSGMKRCNVCKFCYPSSSTFCNLCGSAYNVTLNSLIEAAKTTDQIRQSQSTLSINEESNTSEEIGVVRKWMFYDSILEDPDTKCEICGATNWREVKIMKTQKQILLLNQGSYLRFSHPFVSARESVYLNVWSIVMDIIISDIDSREYTCLLQTDPTNQLPGSFFVRRDGSCGIGVYSAPDVIKNNGYHRIIISADLPNHCITWYVDGKKQGELTSETMPGAHVVPDDRWSLDETFLVGTDNDPRYIGSIYITALQLRRKTIQEKEAKLIGVASLEGPPEPSNEDIICNLMRDLNVPRGWCVIALENIPSHNERRARKWIQENAANINRVLLSEVRSLEKLGYDSNRSKRLILTYAKREKALEILESNILDEASKSTPALEQFVAELEKQETMEEKEKNLNHPGVFNELWSCCGQPREALGCTLGDGRTVGVIAAGDRVCRGPHWRWGDQDGNGCGTVQSITNWDIHLSKGVIVRWDNGSSGLYRWNVNDCFDVAIINEYNKKTRFSISSVYGNDSALENPAYEVVDDIKARFNSSQIRKKTRFPDIRDATLPEIRNELCISSHALSSSYSRVALLNVLSLTNADSTTSDQITTQSLFMNKQDNLFQCFLSAFIHVDERFFQDSNPLNELKKEITAVMKMDVKKVEDGMKVEDGKKNKLLYFWLHSFTRCIFNSFLHEVSLLVQPIMPEACQNLPILSCSKYTLIARFPERGISFWYPAMGIPFATVLKTGEGGTLSIPPDTSTFVLNNISGNTSDNFAKPVRYDLFSTITTANGEIFSIWKMIPPADYVSFGMVVSKGDRPLGLSDYVCIKRSLLSLGQAINIEEANEVMTSPISFWTSHSMISHFYITQNVHPPDSNLVFTLRGENDEHNMGSIDEIEWMLNTFNQVTSDPSQPMGLISKYVYKSEIIHGLMLSFEKASPESRKRILTSVSQVLRRMRADNVNRNVLFSIADISTCMDTLYFQQKQNNIFSPSFQSLVEVITSVYLMCYDSSKEGNQITPIYKACSQQPYFQAIAKVAIAMEALVHRKERSLPLEYILDPYMISILVRLRRSLVFQSEHPYMDMLHRQTISCPNASHLTFRFDSECCSEEDDVFALFPNAETRNPLLLVSGNKFSQLQTKAATNSVYLEFPFCQMNTLQWIYKKEIMAYNDTKTIVGYRCKDVWYSITTDKCFSSGIVSFTFCIRHLNRLNLFIGVSGVSLSNTCFLGSDTSSWGLMASGTIWHNSRKQQFCNPLAQNDIVKLVVNFSEHTLSISVNGQFQGVAFRNIPTNRPIMPALSFFDPGDMVELVNYKVCATTYSQANIDIDYISNESSEESAQWLKRVPERRLKLARDMAKMGFDVHACVLALEATSDDMQVAADYVLTNMKELSQKTAHLIDSQNRVASEKERDEKIDWFMNAFLEDEKQRSMHRLPWTCPYCQTGNDFTQRQCMRCEMKKPDIESAELMEKNRFRWGFRLHVLPDFEPEYLNQLTQEMINSNCLTLPGFEKWTLEADHSLVELASEFCYLNNRDIMTLFPGHLVPNDRLLMKYIKLIDFTMSQLQMRFYVLQQFNKMIRDSLPFINIASEDSALARNLRSLRGLIFRTTKNSWLSGALSKSEYSGRVMVSLDRKRASDFKEQQKEDAHAIYSLFGQLFQQVKSVEPCKLRNNKQPLSVEFRGEYGDDVGGLFRETMTEVSKELESSLLPLFIPSPNGRNEIGKNRDMFIPNPKSTTPVCIEMYEFLGKLMGISIRSQTPLVINIADLFWKRLVGMEIGIEDILSLDLEFSTRINTILDSGKEGDGELWGELCKQMQLTYTVKNSLGEIVELFPGGKDVYVPWSERLNYIDMMKEYRVKELDTQIDAVYRGLASQIPRHFLKLFTPSELKVVVVGRGDINVALLKENTEYGDGYSEQSPAIQYFWNVLTSFSDEERELYLKFVWGRSRLPLDSKSFTTKHVINKMDRRNPNQYCPVSHTCFFQLDLPSYSSETICRERLLYAIHNCQDIDADDTARAAAAAQR